MSNVAKMPDNFSYVLDDSVAGMGLPKNMHHIKYLEENVRRSIGFKNFTFGWL